MLLLAATCAVISALMIVLIGLWQRFAANGTGLPFEKALYARFVTDIERREARGDIDADLAHEERVEAARALLKAQEKTNEQAPATEPRPRLAMLAIIIAVALSFGLYFLIGTPQLRDQPYKRRLNTWAAQAQADPASLPPAALAAVLRHKVKGHQNEPNFWLALAHIDMTAGNFYDGAKDYEHARDLSPSSFTSWSELGEALTFVAKGASNTSAQQAFAQALALDPKDGRANFYLGKMNFDAGHYDLAKAQFQTVLDQLPANDSRRPAVENEIRSVATAQTAQAAMHARITGMVATLEAQLKASPENPPGWARLLRSYNVLGDADGEARTLAAVKAHYAARPDVAASIINNAQNAVGSEDTGSQP